MNVIFSLNGKGERFFKEGYHLLKPLIPVKGRSIFFRCLEVLRYLPKESKIFIPYHHSLVNHDFEVMTQEYLKEYDVTVTFIACPNDDENPQKRPVQTLEYVWPFISDDEKIICLDGDNLYLEDIFSLLEPLGNALLLTKITVDSQLYSFAKIENGVFQKIVEKEKISDLACIGVYQFKNKEEVSFKHSYLSEIFNDLANVEYAILENFISLGTPRQLELAYPLLQKYPQRFCFDFDGTLVNAEFQPILSNVELLKKLYLEGDYIIIYTSRGMQSCNSNQGKMAAKMKWVMSLLEKYQIPYHEIYFNKPFADYYIDDKAVNHLKSNIFKELGFFHSWKAETRECNKLEKKTVLVKTGPLEKIQGEIFWYQNIPERLKSYFPRFYHADKNSYTIEELNALPLSQLLINKTLSKEILIKVLKLLGEIHGGKAPYFEYDILENYQPKYRKRIAEIKKMDRSFYQRHRALIEEIDEKLSLAEPREGLIHGDPVFSNILIDESENIYFIDMRGLQGDVVTMYGDIYYDYAKIYQSLLGYDIVIANLEVESYQPFLKNLQQIFWQQQPLAQILFITRSLVMSLLPLHPRERWEKFISLL